MNKNDPNDARSVAVAALQSAACPRVRADDHAAVLKAWAKRHRDLSRARNQVACRLHAVLCDLIPGGVSKRISAAAAARVLEQAEPCGHSPSGAGEVWCGPGGLVRLAVAKYGELRHGGGPGR